MKKILLLFAALLVVSGAMAQAKKPTIMVVPSDVWCKENGYMTKFDNQGTAQMIPDYKQALQSNYDIRVLVSKMGDIMAREDFLMKSLEQELKRLDTEQAEISVMAGKDTGAGISESPIESLNRTAKCDIIVDLSYQVLRNGPRQQVTFNVQAIDAYTSKIISGNTGVSTSSAAVPLTSLLEEVVIGFMDNFESALQTHFDDMFENGREIVVTMRKFDSSPVDFESEFNYNGIDAELGEIIQVWFEQNTVHGRFSTAEYSTNVLKFNQVRMPLYGKSLSGNETAMDSRSFVRPLVSMLGKYPYDLPCKIYQKGLGEVVIILGEK